MISFLSAIVYFFYVLISEYIETLNCLNFSKNWKNGGVLKLQTGSVVLIFGSNHDCRRENVFVHASSPHARLGIKSVRPILVEPFES